MNAAAPECSATCVRAGDLIARAKLGRRARLRAMVGAGLRMMLHDKLKLLGTLAGVIVAVVLSVQQLGILLGLLQRNTMFVDNAGADVWIIPPDTQALQPGQQLSSSVLMRARTTPGVAVASPLVLAGGSVLRPGGGTEAVTIVGTELPHLLGGPWNIVAGDTSALEMPDTMFFEDSKREDLGGVNLGSVRELNGRRVRVGGFTWGLQPFGPPYAFAEVETARRLTGMPVDEMSFVLVRVRDGTSPEAVAAELSRRVPEATVTTREAFHDSIVRYLLSQQLGVSFGTSTAFGLIVGLVIVSLSMFSSVLDNIREFGTLKAIGCTNRDLTALLLTQSAGVALLGSFLGLAIVSRIAGAIRSARLVMIVPDAIVYATPVVMLALCLLASVLALARIRKLEPGMVFR